MKIQYCSDLHIEFPENKEFLKSNPLQAKGDILILAGDIVPFVVMNKHDDFFNYISDNFKYTFWIPGNHEYYYFDITKKIGSINEKIRSNVFLVNNTSVQHDDIKFIFSTLWSMIDPSNQWTIQRSMSDFQVIKHKEDFFTPFHYNQLHQDSIRFVKKELNKVRSEKTIVVSHHVPTLLNYPEKYKGDILNQAFAVELYDLIEKSKINYWIFGHHHQNIDNFSIGKTRLVTNQLGYLSDNEHDLFKLDAIFHL